ncbi:MAG: redoxin domain-containing protein [Planctomycetes bacterium]|nr:redoxin domain-containing protein [Planctomycetota bacterium]
MTRNTPVFQRTLAGGMFILLAGLLAVAGCHRGSQTEKSISLGKSDSEALAQQSAKTASGKSDSVADVKPQKTTSPDQPAPKETEKDPPLPGNPDPDKDQPDKKQPEFDFDTPPLRQFAPAPPLTGGKGWINTAGPLELRQLRGKFVLLDFWTYCCINCIHVLPELKKLEKAYPNELVVIGVHSAKFAGEKDTQNITDAVMRYEIEHPVVNDSEHVIWNRYGVRSWPTMLLIDPEGQVIWAEASEHTFEELDQLMKHVIPYYKKKGLLDLQPIRFDLAAHQAKPTPLRFPGKVLADEAGNRLFITDSNHHRIVVTKLDGTLIETIGTGQIGKADGDYATAQFNRPQGTALVGQTLYVADTENHQLRKIDLVKKTVTTIAGTGVQGRNAWPGLDLRAFRFGEAELPERFVGKASETALNSPWALWVHEKNLYIAMAGPHQIWKMTLDEKEIGPYAGNGQEDIVDGPLLPPEPYRAGYSSFAQPSGLASDGTWLYVADSEGSSIRAVPFNTSADVKTVVGTAWMPSGRLFVFGDVDGQGQRIRLQHALGVLYHDGLLYVDETKNNKIKVIDLLQVTCKTLAGTGEPGTEDDPARFDEPAGLAYAAGKLYVADTNNHAIRTIDLEGGGQVATLEIVGLQPPAPAKRDAGPKFPDAEQVKLPAAQVKPVEGKVRLQVALALPDGYKINPVAPLRYLVESSVDGGPIRREALGKLITVENPSANFVIELPTGAQTGREDLKISMAYYYCRDGSEGVCKAGSVVWNLPLRLSADATDSAVRLPFDVKD